MGHGAGGVREWQIKRDGLNYLSIKIIKITILIYVSFPFNDQHMWGSDQKILVSY